MVKISQIIYYILLESEFVTLELAGSEAEWLKQKLTDIPLGMKPTHQCQCLEQSISVVMMDIHSMRSIE